VKRRCACGTILNRYNSGDECWACEERARLDSLRPVVKPPAPVSTGNPSGLCRCGCGGKTPIAKRNRHKDNVLAGQPVHYMPGHALQRMGRTNGNAKMTAATVIRMRREYERGGTSFRKIALKYGCGETTARQAIRGVSWSHVMDEAA
jgi:hypothetical protein